MEYSLLSGVQLSPATSGLTLRASGNTVKGPICVYSDQSHQKPAHVEVNQQRLAGLRDLRNGALQVKCLRPNLYCCSKYRHGQGPGDSVKYTQ